MTTCNGCNATWTGLKPAHCSACHHTFTAISAFDMHRTGSHANSKRTCLPPATVGLVRTKRVYSCWGQPGDDGEWFGETA